jgi:hypothetical protein
MDVTRRTNLDQRTTCRGPLSSFCLKEKCRSYEATRAAAQSSATPASDAGQSGLEIEVDVGTCGRWRFVRLRDSYSGWTQFFDVSGKIVGATRWSDTNSFCSGKAFAIDYGVVPENCG